MSVWNPENVKDIAESIGITNLTDDATRAMVSDIEYRLCQVLEEALKFMRHGKRTTLTTQDISQALKTLGVEPLYGYESTRPLRFGEASIGPGQPLYYVEDEEMEFEKLINAPLPKVPREITSTGLFDQLPIRTPSLILLQRTGLLLKAYSHPYPRTRPQPNLAIRSSQQRAKMPIPLLLP